MYPEGRGSAPCPLARVCRVLFMPVFTPRGLCDLHEARIALESDAACLSCERLSKEEADGPLTQLSQADEYLSVAEDPP